MVMRTFSGVRLNQLRLKRGYTQDDFAHELRLRGMKTSAKQIRRWEMEAHTPRASVVPMLADALGVKIDSLYGSNGSDDDDEESDPMASLYAAVRRVVRAEIGSAA